MHKIIIAILLPHIANASRYPSHTRARSPSPFRGPLVDRSRRVPPAWRYTPAVCPCPATPLKVSELEPTLYHYLWGPICSGVERDAIVRILIYDVLLVPEMTFDTKFLLWSTVEEVWWFGEFSLRKKLIHWSKSTKIWTLLFTRTLKKKNLLTYAEETMPQD